MNEDEYPGIHSPYALGQIWRRHDWRGVWYIGNHQRGMIVAFLGTRAVIQYLRDDGTFAEGSTVMWQSDWKKSHESHD